MKDSKAQEGRRKKLKKQKRMSGEGRPEITSHNKKEKDQWVDKDTGSGLQPKGKQVRCQSAERKKRKNFHGTGGRCETEKPTGQRPFGAGHKKKKAFDRSQERLNGKPKAGQEAGNRKPL